MTDENQPDRNPERNTTMLTTIAIPRSLLPRGHYAEHVANYGHTPGVLSGAEIKGEARSFGWYARQRAVVARAVRALGVEDGLHLVNSRHCRVWIKDGQPVELVLS